MRFVFLAVAACCLSFAVSLADGPTSKEQPPTATPSAEEIDRLILQLGDDEMDKRAAAAARLEAAGEPATASLKKAAESADDPEVRKAAKVLLDKFAAKAQGLLHDFRGSNAQVNAVVITADGKRGVSAHIDGALRIWDLERYLLIRQIAGHTGPVNCVVLSPDGRRLLSGGNDRAMKLWDAEIGVEVRSFAGHPNSVVDVAFSPEGKTILSGCADRNARLWDAGTGKHLLTMEGHGNDYAWTVAYTPDGKRGITGGNTGYGPPVVAPLRLWELTTGNEIRRFACPAVLLGHPVLSPDGKLLLAAGNDGTLRLWDLDTGQEVKTFYNAVKVNAVGFMPDGKRIIWLRAPAAAMVPEFVDRVAAAAADAGNGDKQWNLILRDLATGNDIKQFGGHRNPVTSFAISADGRRLLSGSTDGSMRLWELPK